MSPNERARREWLFQQAEQAFHVKMEDLVKERRDAEAVHYCTTGAGFLLAEEEALRRSDSPGRPGKSIRELMSIAALLCFADLLRKAHAHSGNEISKAQAAEAILAEVKPHGLEGSAAVAQLEAWSKLMECLPKRVSDRLALVYQNVMLAGRWHSEQAQILMDATDAQIAETNADSDLPGKPALPLTPNNVLKNLRDAIKCHGLRVTWYAKP